MKGILFYQDREIDPDEFENKINSGANSNSGGTLYFPNNALIINSGNEINSGVDWALIVANRVEVSSDSIFHMGSDINGERPGGAGKVTLVEGRLY